MVVVEAVDLAPVWAWVPSVGVAGVGAEGGVGALCWDLAGEAEALAAACTSACTAAAPEACAHAARNLRELLAAPSQL